MPIDTSGEALAMNLVDAKPISDLASAVSGMNATIPVLTTLQQIFHPLPIPIPSKPPVQTTLVRGSTTIGYIVTPGLDPAPTAIGVALKAGTLWLAPSQFGTAFASATGWVGIPFASAGLAASGSVTFGSGEITLAATATLTFAITSSVQTTSGPAGDPIGADFLNAKLVPFPQATIALAPAGATIALGGAASATLYGQILNATPNAAPEPVLLTLGISFVAIPCTAPPATFTIGTALSLEVAVAGNAPFVEAATLFPILTASPGAFPDPDAAWGLSVAVGAGLTARFGTLTSPVPLGGAIFALTGASLFGVLLVGATSATDRYTLWESPASPSPLPPTWPDLAFPPAQVAIAIDAGALIGFNLTPTQETVEEFGQLTALLDRPVGADGSRIAISGVALVVRARTAGSIALEIASTLTSNPAEALALMAENALIPVGAPNGFVLGGTVQNAGVAGTLEVTFPTDVLIPTLPDPYAALYIEREDAQRLTGVGARVTWTETGPPDLTFFLFPAVEATTGAAPGATLSVAGEAVRGGVSYALLDVSTNADQWGVGGFIGGGISQFTFDKLVLNAPNADAFVFTVPGISWEPIVDGNTTVPEWLSAASPDDGTPTVFLVERKAPTPIVPIAALLEYQGATRSSDSNALFTLPFGITASLASTPGASAPTYTIPAFGFPQAGADGMQGVRVLSITGAGSDPLSITLPGTATVGFDTSDPGASGYGAQVLGVSPLPSPASFWDQQFATGGVTPEIPVGRIDLSGYGTSMFADWRDPSVTDVGVVRALFDVLLGRTSHEIVQLQTWILPWSIRLQRSIVFDRSDGGEVIKHDSGWKAVDVGKYALLGTQVLPGPVAELANVRNLTFSNTTVTAAGKTYNPVTFEADVMYAAGLSIAANGSNDAPSTVGLQILGYADDTVGTAPMPAEVITLMQKVGRTNGQTSCIARIGGSGATQFTVNVSAFGAAVAAGATPKLQTALYGTPLLSKDGQWSVSQRPQTQTRPQAVAAGTPVPLTLGTPGTAAPPTGGHTYAHGWRLLDPEDAQDVDAPKTFYGILQGTGVSKTLYENPLVSDAGNALGFGNKPVLADVGALLGVGDLFPELASALQIPSTNDLPLNGDGFKRTYTWTINEPDRSLLNLGIVHLALQYQAGGTQAQGTLVLDSTGDPTWQLTLTNLGFTATVDGFGSGPLLTITGGFQAGSNISPGFTDLNVTYGSSLQPIQDIFSGLSTLATDLGGDANLDVGFSGQTLSVLQSFTLPTIPLGFGDITNLGLDLGFTATIPTDLGFHVGIGSKTQPFQWLVDPLSGTGAIVLGVQGGGIDVYIEAGIGVGLGIDLAIASGSASIVVSMSLDISSSLITIVLMLTGNADVDVLGGLASASLTLSAALGISFPPALPPPSATLSAEVAVGIHISICWVISIDFDGSWSMSEQVSLS
jgi:hypothetical protein